MVIPQRPPPDGAKAATGDIPPVSGAPVVALRGRIGPPEIGEACARVRALFVDDDVRIVVIDVSEVVDPDAAALDALARLHLTARRLGRGIRIRHTCAQLEELAAFAGLREVLLGCDEERQAGSAPPSSRR